MEYEIAIGDTPEELEEVVRAMIKEGYTPQGGVASTPAGHGMQAMIRKAKK